MAPAVRYHHGDLPNALKEAAVGLITEKGPAGFSLREVARRAGVSHAAPAHHFGDSTGLLTALAVDAFRVLHGALAEAAASTNDPSERLVVLGKAYIQVGRSYPAHTAVVFRSDLVDVDNPDYAEWGAMAYQVLVDTIEDIRAAHNPDLDVADAATLTWSAMQGLVELFSSIHKRALVFGQEPPDVDELVERVSRLILAGIAPGA